jgi:hypothetical protein
VVRYLTMALLLAVAAPASGADDDKNRGQVVSDCNQRASARNIKGQDRKDFLDWCVARSDPFDDSQGNRYSDCNSRANQRGLRNEERRNFIDWCVDRDDRAARD